MLGDVIVMLAIIHFMYKFTKGEMSFEAAGLILLLSGGYLVSQSIVLWCFRKLINQSNATRP
jgi:hypothetical protein